MNAKTIIDACLNNHDRTTTVPAFICADWQLEYEVPLLVNVDVQNKQYTEYSTRPYTSVSDNKLHEILLPGDIEISILPGPDKIVTELIPNYAKTLDFIIDNTEAVEKSIIRQFIFETFGDTRGYSDSSISQYITVLKEIIERDTGVTPVSREEFFKKLLVLQRVGFLPVVTGIQQHAISIFYFTYGLGLGEIQAIIYDGACITTADDIYTTDDSTTEDIFSDILSHIASRNTYW